MIRDPASGEKPTVFTCADDKAARSTVIALAILCPLRKFAVSHPRRQGSGVSKDTAFPVEWIIQRLAAQSAGAETV